MTNEKIAAITAQFKNDIPNDGSSLILSYRKAYGT